MTKPRAKTAHSTPTGTPTSPAGAKKIVAILEAAYPDARVTLDFKNPFQLLIATILAALCTESG